MKTFDKRKFNGKTYTHFNYYRKKKVIQIKLNKH